MLDWNFINIALNILNTLERLSQHLIGHFFAKNIVDVLLTGVLVYISGGLESERSNDTHERKHRAACWAGGRCPGSPLRMKYTSRT